ncbi:MAG: TIGR02186 family protein [Pseudomonadota bacterium]
MNKLSFLIYPFLLIISAPAQSAPLVADLSNYTIAMDSSFNGTRLFLFGVRNDTGDIVVVVRGPEKNYIVRKKEKIAGVWVNRDRIKFYNVPNYYAMASSKTLSDINKFAIFDRMGIGENNLLNNPSIPNAENLSEFETAFLNHQRINRLYYTNPDNISFMGETLFKTVIEFSDKIPSGEYTAEIYLISDGEIVGMQSTPISVAKSGLDAFIYNYAHNSPVLYGISAIILALSFGWLAGRLFEIRA